MNDENVLVIPAGRLAEIGGFHGFRPFCPEAFGALMNPRHMEFRPRRSVEEDPTFKQLIPYAILQAEIEGVPHVFQYTRGRGQGEKRLHALRSIGIGGHISEEDAIAEDPYRSGMLRELEEEMYIESEYSEELVGFIYDDTSPVGRVHLGVVHRLTLAQPQARARECELTDGRFAPIDELKRHIDEFETWSQLCLTHLF
ncbi:MAG: phosphoesterase [Pirellulaceae bacterium]|nr:MAG: phosphoesterase [Pirellulaceae bacterium]